MKGDGAALVQVQEQAYGNVVLLVGMEHDAKASDLTAIRSAVTKSLDRAQKR